MSSIKFSLDTVSCVQTGSKHPCQRLGPLLSLELGMFWHNHPALLFPVLCFGCGCCLAAWTDRQTELVQLSR